MYYVYILTNHHHTTLYIGVTRNLEQRVYQHKQKLVEGFTSRYNLHKLVYFEETTEVHSALTREKQLKGWLRRKKAELITAMNPEWRDLSEDWYT